MRMSSGGVIRAKVQTLLQKGNERCIGCGVTITHRRGSDKRRGLLDGALEVFAADGYARVSIDAIARAAGVSSRTIYNQFGDKAGLFEAVIVDSARRVADSQVAVADRLLGGVPGRTRDVEA